MTNFNPKGMLDDSIYKEVGDLLAVGGWMIEMPKDGSHPRLYGNRQMHAIFEAPEDLSAEELFDFWFERIIPTFKGSSEMIRQTLANDDQVERDSCYAWQHPSKGCVFIRVRGARGVSENGNTWLKGLVEVVETEFQFRMPERKPFKILEARKLQIYAPYFLETYEEIHEIDPVTLRVTPLGYRHDHYEPRPKDADLYELHRLDLHPEDFERIEAALDKKTLEGIIFDGKELTLQFRVADKVLGWRWVEAKYFAVEYWGTPKILVTAVDVEARRRVRTLEAENCDLIEAMFNIYAAVLEVDLTTGMTKFLKSMDGDPQDMPDGLQIDQFSCKIVPRIVLASERDNFRSYMDLDNLRRAAACHEHKDCTIRMRSFLKEAEYSTVRISRRYIENRLDKLYIVVIRETFNPTANEIANNLASQTCDCLYYVDLTTGYFRCIFTKDESVAEYEGEGYWKNLLKVAERYIVPEDREMVLRMLSGTVVKAELEANDEYTFSYGMIYDNREYRRKEIIVRYADRKHSIAIIQRNDVTDAYEAARRQELRLALIEHEASLDGLTKCFNRSAGIKRIDEHLIASHGTNALLLLDLDNFKDINDTFGHLTGDEVLKHFAETLKKSVRASDLVVRIGGDEFIVFLKDVGSRENVTNCVKKISMRIQTEHYGVEDDFDVGASMGVAVAPDDGGSFDKLYEKADEALYRIKRGSKNGYAFVKN
ncbi:sensor domain-containing diguanylate cyclase [Sutterella sp.]|uniref:sensor domain-containing diguanylate cyclase n=1 Tax=Sutterella sp. TaxID=1981025 RepID=UPI003FD8BBEF